MSAFPITPEDLLGFVDVLKDLDVDVDSLPPKEAVDMRDALEKILKQVRASISNLDSHLIKVLEAGELQVRGDMVYSVGRKTQTVRYDHDRILSRAAAVASVDEETGEFVDRATALHRLIRFFEALYLSDSTKAKVGGLRRIDMSRESVETVTWGDKTVKAVEARFAPQEVPE